jgi:hypothetical protein
MFSKLNIVNNRVCPFCKENIESNLTLLTDRYDHCFCKTGCIKVMYENTSPSNWILIRVYLTEKSTIKADKRDDEKLFYLFDYKEEIILPPFDIFSYSLTALESKIKKYLVFS